MGKPKLPPPAPGSAFGLSVGDLMAALLLVFVLLLAATLLQLQEEYDNKAYVAEEYVETKRSLVEALREEFGGDLERWNAELDEEQLLIRFNSEGGTTVGGPRFYWARAGDYLLNDDHRAILSDFFPRYVAVINRDSFRQNIQEVRIEGHTDVSWYDTDNAYIGNMALSQNRTRSVLAYAIETLPASAQTWVQKRVTANGLSSSKLLLPSLPNDPRNRRVEFRIITNAEQELAKLLDLKS